MKIGILCVLLIIGLTSGWSQSNPVEQGDKEAPEQQPTFPEQTRVPAVKTVSDYSVEVITEDLAFPWGLDFLPDGRMVVSEKPGNIHSFQTR